MTTPEHCYDFDVLSYPLGAEEKTIIFDVPTTYISEKSARLAADNQHGGSPYNALLISDSLELAHDAVAAGMGAAVVGQQAALDTVVNLLRTQPEDTVDGFYDHPLYTELSYDDIAQKLYKPGQVHTVGFVGRTGAGKSTTINHIIDRLEQQGGAGARFEIDSFFIRSREERKAWLNEPDISDEERAERKRVITWWDLGRAANTLQRIRSGEHVQLNGLYDMQQGGQMVGTMNIKPDETGYTVFVEGTALLVPELRDSIDTFVYFNTHDQVRGEFLMQRNTAHGYTAEESQQRKALTDAAETKEHLSYDLRQQRAAAGRLVVLDNTSRSDTLRLMPPFIPQK